MIPIRVPQSGTAVRPTWEELPYDVRHAVEDAAGSPVRTAISQGGGFTSGFASRLELEDGRRLFVKAATSDVHVFARPSYEREAAVVRGLPAAVPAPRVLWTRDLGAWFVSAFEDVQARHPVRPWDPRELAAVLDLCTVMARELTPAPPGLGVVDIAEYDDEMSFWRRRSAGAADALAVALPSAWEGRVDELARLEARWAERGAGETAMHFDLRDDNILLTADGRVLVCDWNWLTRAAAWLDLAALLVSVHGDGLDADARWASHPLAREAADGDLEVFLAAMAGMFVERSAEPRDERSPYLREHQAWWRDATLSWLELRLAR